MGDDDQSIYSGRFADPSGIVNFQAFYPGTIEIKLPVCSRCPTPIITASHNLINKNSPKKRVVKPRLIALPETDKNADGGYVASVYLKSAKEESRFLASAIKAIIKDDPARACEIMVLCVSRLIGLELIEALKSSDSTIPIEDKLTKDIKKSPYVIVNYLKRFLDNHVDNLALRMFACVFLNITAKGYSVIFDESKGSGILWEGLQKTINRKELKKDKQALAKFINIINSTENKPIEDKLRICSQGYPDLKDAIEQIITNPNVAKESQEDEQRLSNPSTPKGVQFMTMHNSKGLDANFVFIPFMEQEVRLPGIDLEEQRRLLYVALTRARVSVVFSWAFSRRSASRHKAGGGSFMCRSRSDFIKECGIVSDLPAQNVINRLSQIAKLAK